MNRGLKKSIFFIIIVCCIISSFVACDISDYKLEFIVDGEVYKTITTNGREAIELPPAPQKDDYVFDGWYWDEGAWQEPFSYNDFVYKPLSSNAKLYAKWKEKESLQGTQADFDGFNKTEEYTYSLVVDSDVDTLSLSDIVKVNSNSTWILSKDPLVNEPISDKTATLEIGENIYYVLVTAQDDTNQIYKLIINRKEPLFKVTFDTDGGEEVEPLYVRKGDIIEEPEKVDKKGYTFLGWDYDFSQPIQNDIIIEAIFEANEYTVTFDSNGGELSEKTLQVVYDSQIVLPVPSKLGYEFKGWYKDSELIENGAWTIDDNVELRAEWQLESYTITYNLNKGTNNQLNPDSYTIQSEDIVLQKPLRSGCLFEGWYSDSMFVNKVETIVGGSIGNIELWAKWQPMRYNITYDLKGGVNNEQNPDSFTVEDHIVIQEPTKAGYTFIGWSSTDWDGMQKEIVISSNVFTSLALTANWQENEEMSAFNFSSVNNRCTIQSVKDKNVTSVVIPYYVTDIGDEAFRDCDKLQIVTFEENSQCTQIGKYAFQGCASLQSIELAASLELISASAFRYCDNLKDVYFDGDLADWCNIEFINSFSNPGTFANDLYIDGELLQGDVVIPDGVTRIHYGAFSNRTGIKSVVIPYGVTEIGDYAFENCSSLTDIAIPEGVTNIGEYAFYRCGSLTDISIPAGVTSIGGNAFNRCSSLTDIAIPDSVTSIGEYVFYKCSNLKSAMIPEGVTSIADGLFYDCVSLESVVIPDSITSIGSSAFAGCVSLSGITIPADVMSIGNNAFYNCNSLKNIEVKSGNTVYRSSGNCLIETATKTLLYGCQNSVIPDDGSVAQISAGAFYNCVGLRSIVIPDSVTVIENGAFEECVGLESVVLSQEITSIRSEVFLNCNSLKSIVIPDSVTTIENRAFEGCGSLTNLTIGKGVTNIGEKAFYDCYGLVSVIIGNAVNDIGKNAFGYCESLTAVYYEGDVASWCDIVFADSDSNPVNYAENLYIAGELLEHLILPQGVESIGEYVFYNCKSLKSVTIPVNIKSIGQYAFANCNIDDVYYQGDLAGWCGMNYGNVDANPMYSAKNLYINGRLLQGELVIPDNVTNIAAAAFANCNSLTDITIPASVTNISERAFSECNNVVSITVPVTVLQMQYGAFENCNKLVLYVEAASKPEGWHNNWCRGIPVIWDCNNNNLANDGYRYITYEGLNYAIKDNEAKVVGNNVDGTVVIASEIEYEGEIYKVNYVDAWAFSNCNDITSVVFPKWPSTIASYAFENCSNLTYVFISGSPSDFGLLISGDGNDALLDMSRHYYYSETQPSKEGNYWHYVDGKPTIW